MSKKFKQPKPKRTLKAIDKLIKHYEKYAMNVRPPSYQDIKDDSCPLCHVHIKYALPTYKGCASCPWYTIDNIGCMVIVYKQEVTEKRLLRLKRWKRKIQGGKSCQLK